jgi:hypothetical protein
MSRGRRIMRVVRLLHGRVRSLATSALDRTASFDEGRYCDVYRYRPFVGRNLDPIRPRSEVYRNDWTPAGWLSWSDLQGDEGERQQKADAGDDA